MKKTNREILQKLNPEDFIIKNIRSHYHLSVFQFISKNPKICSFIEFKFFKFENGFQLYGINCKIPEHDFIFVGLYEDTKEFLGLLWKTFYHHHKNNELIKKDRIRYIFTNLEEC